MRNGFSPSDVAEIGAVVLQSSNEKVASLPQSAVRCPRFPLPLLHGLAEVHSLRVSPSHFPSSPLSI
jgi:hypothetical protein